MAIPRRMDVRVDFHFTKAKLTMEQRIAKIRATDKIKRAVRRVLKEFPDIVIDEITIERVDEERQKKKAS